MTSTSMAMKSLRYFPLLMSSHSDDVIREIKYAVVFGSSAGSMFFVTRADDVYGVGGNSNGFLGAGGGNEQKSPIKVAELCGKEVVDIVAGSSGHVMASTSDGKLFVWGYNGYYQLGNGTTTTSYSPQLCTGLDGFKVSRIACGYGHSLVVTEDHEVFAWGLSDHGQAAVSGNYQTVPQRVTALNDEQPIDVKCNVYSSFALTADGDVFSWGRGYAGQLGTGSCANTTSPQRIEGDLKANVKAIACGSDHSLVVTRNGHVFAWGSGGNGQIGVDRLENVATPTRVDVENFRIEEVGASVFSNASLARTSCGKVFVWGICRGEQIPKPRLTLFSSFAEVSLHLSDVSVTYTPLTCEEERPAGVRRCLREHFDAEEASDVDFLVEDEVVRGHVSFLRMRSPYLRAMLSPTWTKGQREIRVEGHSLGVFRAFLRFLYTDELHVGEESGVEEAVGLLRLADEYGEAALKAASEDLIRRLVSVDTVLEIYASAIQLSAKTLQDYCLEFCFNHLSAVTKSEAYMKLDLTIIRDLFLKAASCQAFKK